MQLFNQLNDDAGLEIAVTSARFIELLLSFALLTKNMVFPLAAAKQLRIGSSTIIKKGSNGIREMASW